MASHDSLPTGLYETLISRHVEQRIAQLGSSFVRTSKLHKDEAPDRIALHLARQIEHAIRSAGDDERLETALAIVEAILEQLGSFTKPGEYTDELLAPPGLVLKSVAQALPDGSPRRISEPLIPLLDTTLLTNSPGEPALGLQVNTEIDSADEISLLMAFITVPGLNFMIKAVRDHCAAGKRMRVLTTTYTGITEQSALDLLTAAGAEVRVSYDVSQTRLHAKSWIFRRLSGFSTAYIGSSNLTSTAQTHGLEWNVRASSARNPGLVEKMRAVFESYWENPDFRPYDPDEFAEHRQRTQTASPIFVLAPIAVTPYPFQARLLEQLAVSRQLGHHRNLLVAATGTGKTVMAALDYKSLAGTLDRSRLLFLAHRKEILEQSQNTFRQVLLDANFGEQWFGGRRPTRFEHVFASVQSLSHTDLDHLDPAHFDVVIIDEFHHAAASSYERLLNYLQPQELLGLTATPERADGLSILSWFGGRIAAELRLWDAIEQQHLAPFHYFGIHDGLDYSSIPWKRGQGYDVAGLTNLYTATDIWAAGVLKEFGRRCSDVSRVRALGFCVSVEHARFMERVFRESGVEARAIWAETPASEREQALKDLKSGALNVLFSVDLFNEGVDVPSVDVLLLLRPTDSPTLFLQQLGRGLRKSAQKTVCTVLDFVGTHRKEFRFDRRFAALLGGTRKGVLDQVERGFPFLPAGCYMELDERAADIIIANIKSSLPTSTTARVEALIALIRSGARVSLASFIEQSGLTLEEVYRNDICWSDLQEMAGLPTGDKGPQEVALRRVLGRLLHTDDHERLELFANLLSRHAVPQLNEMPERTQRCVSLLLTQFAAAVPPNVLPTQASLQDALDLVWEHPQVRAEAVELFNLLRTRIDHLHWGLDDRPTNPLLIHAQYTRHEILAAFGDLAGPRSKAWREGVRWLEPESADVFAFTLDKETGSFSPTTRYRDYALSPELIHWESQSTTSDSSPTGLRYQRHASLGSDVYLFARLHQSDRAFWFLGPATYVSHEGSRPLAITWRLRHPLPGDLYANFAAAVA